MFFSSSDVQLVIGLILLLFMTIPCAAIGAWGLKRNTPPAVKEAVKRAATAAAKAAIQSQINRRF